MLSIDERSYRDELRISPQPILILLALLSTGMMLASYDMVDYVPICLVAMALYGTALAAWLLGRYNTTFARWLIVVGSMILVDGLAFAVRVPNIGILRIAATGLAAVMLGLLPAALIALAETLLILVLPPDVRGAVPLHLAELGAIWGTWALMFAAYRPAYRFAEWSIRQVLDAQTLAEETRSQRQLLKQALKDLEQANHQSALMNERLAAARLLAEEAQKTKAAFVAKVSHEFRTPLNLIIGLIDLITETPGVYGRPLPDTLLEDMEIVHRSCEHLASMINDVLDLSQMEAGQMAIHREELDLEEVIDQAVDVVRPLLDMKELGLQVDVAAGLPHIHCDRTRIRQVILNLVSNAARFTAEGSISIRAIRKGMNVLVSVIDTGMGIAIEDSERIFEPFYQAAGSQYAASGGSGLGLSISKQFVELHGGRMWVKSEVGAGSDFSFELPIWPSVDAVAAPTRWLSEEWQWRRHLSSVPTPEAHLDQRYIICDRGYELLSLVQRHAPDWEFVRVTDIPTISQILGQAPAQAVVMNAPDIGELLDMLQRGLSLVPDTPLLGCTLDLGVAEGRLASIVRYLIKPFKRADLERTIMQGLGAVPSRVLLVDDDPDTVSLMRRMLLTSFPNITVLTAGDGQGALAILREQLPDLLLLDVVLPDMDGWKLLDIKIADPAVRDIPVIMVSAQDLQNRPPNSPLLVAAMPEGISINKLLRCWQMVSRCLLQPERPLYQAPG